MKYFSVWEVLRALAATAIYGAVLGVLYCIFSTAVMNARKLLALPGAAVRFSLRFSPREMFCYAGEETGAVGWRVLRECTDFLYFSAAGIGYLLLLYVFCDGMLRLYTVVGALLMYLFARRIFAGIYGRVSSYLFCRLYFFLLFSAAVALFFPCRILRWGYRHFFVPMGQKLHSALLAVYGRERKRRHLRSIRQFAITKR